MLDKIARALHATLGWGAVVLAGIHILAVSNRAEDAFRLWTLGLAVLIPGLLVAWSARRLGGGALAATGSLALASLVELIAYRATMPAIFVALSVLDAALLSAIGAGRRRWLQCAMGAAMCLVVVFLAMSASAAPLEP